MSQENVRVVRAAFEAWNAGDMDALRDLHDPDVVLRPPDGWPEAGPFIGREAAMRQSGRCARPGMPTHWSPSPTSSPLLTGGISRGDLKALGAELDEGSAAVVVIGESKIEEQLAQATKRANKLIEQQVDADPDELKREIEATAKEGTSSG